LRLGSGKTARFIFFQGNKMQVAFVLRKNFASAGKPIGLPLFMKG
jgi:hypothetical protein